MSLMRSALLWASTNPFLARRLPRMRFVQKASRRFMPGEEPEAALREGAKLQEKGAPTLVTLLGENVDDRAAAGEVADAYLDLQGKIEARGLDMELSVKPTQFGLDLGMDVCVENMRRVLDAVGSGVVWIDMESSAYVDPTLELYRTLKESHDDVGLCLQSYLYRTPDDVEALLPLKPAIRLVKGAYMEPESVAYPEKADVDRAYLDITERLLDARKEGTAGRVGVGTHDTAIIRAAAALARERGLGAGDWEVEMLFGIAVREQERLLEEGVPLRVLISYGEHWFPWYMRRLAERPANVWFVLKQMVG